MSENRKPNIIYKSYCPSLIPPWYFCMGCDYRLSLDHVYCPKCGTKLNWDTILEQVKEENKGAEGDGYIGKHSDDQHT